MKKSLKYVNNIINESEERVLVKTICENFQNKSKFSGAVEYSQWSAN